jgi:hypothetical protein
MPNSSGEVVMLPPSSTRIVASSSLVPKPPFLVIAHSGLARQALSLRSRHEKTRCSGLPGARSMRHQILNSPSSDRAEPYLSALVASSWKASPKACAAPR